MCLGKLFAPSTPKLPAAPARSDAEVQAASEAARRRALAAGGYGSTIMTGGGGDLSAAPVTVKTLLGQ
jgi:hypothetical protein